MNKALLLAILLTVGNFKKQEETSFFEKYTYLLYLQNKEHTRSGAGTGFLIEKDNSIFCVTASHVWNGIDVFRKQYAQLDKRFDTLYFRYKTLNGKTKIISYYLGNDKTEPFYYFEFADLMIFKLPELHDTPILNTVNKYLDLYDKGNGTPEKVFFMALILNVIKILLLMFIQYVQIIMKELS